MTVAAGRRPIARVRRSPPAWLLARVAPGGPEALAAFVLMLVVAAAAFGSHIVNGSFYYDDWANSASTHETPGPEQGFGAALSYFWQVTGYRPLLAFYTPTVHQLLGEHWHLHLAWATTLAAGMAAALYLVLTELRIARLHAALIAILVLIFPYSDVTWLWSQAGTARLTGMLWLLGLWLALRGLDPGRPARSRLLHHLASLALYAASVCIYELPATLMLSGILLYWAHAGLRPALRRFVGDVVVVGGALAWILPHSGIDTATGSSGSLDHAKLIAEGGRDIFARAAWPFGAVASTVVWAIMAAIALSAAVAVFRLPAADPARSPLRRWLVVALGGLVTAAVAWAIFIPSHPYYTPTPEGLANRVNVLAAIGVIVTLYALAMLAGALAGRALGRHAVHAGAAVAALFAVVLAVGYIRDIDADKARWDAAGARQQTVLATIASTIPTPPSNAVFLTFDAPLFEAPGVPVFGATWDLDGAVKLLFDRNDLTAYPVDPRFPVFCAPGAIAGPYSLPYGRTYFIDIGARRAQRIGDPQTCTAALAHLTPGPLEATAG